MTTPKNTTSRPSQTYGSEPEMSVVLVCWNNKDYLEPCLRSLFDCGLRASFDVVVVDNGSTDGSKEMLREKFPQVILIENDRNLGLGFASNQGIEATKGKYVLLLNNDTLVNAPSLDAMVDFMRENPKAGAVGGRLSNGDGSFQSGYGDFSTLLEEFLIASGMENLRPSGYPLHGSGNEIKEVGWMSSACLLLRRAALDQVGLLDEEYFIYGDETDLQYRLKLSGWRAYYLPSVNIIHFGGRSMDRWRRRKMVYRGKMLFYKKNYGVLATSALRVMLGTLSLAKILVWSIPSTLLGPKNRARLELRSNLDVVKLCIRLG